jgi:hypothetical protein
LRADDETCSAWLFFGYVRFAVPTERGAFVKTAPTAFITPTNSSSTRWRMATW